MSGDINAFDSIEELGRVRVVRDWLQFKSPMSRKVYLRIFLGFFSWLQTEGDPQLVGKSPEELLDLQESINEDKRRRRLILNEVLRYIQMKGEDWRARYKKKILSTVRSFFVHHLEENGFPRLRNGEAGSVLKSKVRKVEKRLRIRMLKEIIDKSNVMYGAVFRSMLASGMGLGEVVKWSNQGIDGLKEALSNPLRGSDGEELIEAYLPARKQNRETDFYVLIGGSAIQALRKWLRRREEIRRRFDDESLKARRERRRKTQLPKEFPDSIFVTNSFTPLSKSGASTYYQRKIKQLFLRGEGEGATGGKRYGINLHQIRQVFRSRWAQSEASPDVAEYMMGHVVDKLDYNQVHMDREFRINEYCKALPYLDIETTTYEARAANEKAEQATKRIKEMETQIEELRRERQRDSELLRLLLEAAKENPDLIDKLMKRMA